MLQAALQMLPTIERLERLLGHNLNITKEILDSRVRETVEYEIKRHGIVVQPLNLAEVDWQRVIIDAAYRRPPFQLGEKEKGFRDALILETFLQIVASSPTSRSVARLAFVSDDQLLRDATQARLGTATNVHLLESIDALKSLINTLGSAVDEQFIAAIRPRAAEVFFRSRDESTLYYKAAVGVALEQTLAAEAIKLPAGADKYAIEKWTIGSPGFVKKQGQRIHWTTRFEARLKALKSGVAAAWLQTSGRAFQFSSLLPEQDILQGSAFIASPFVSGAAAGAAIQNAPAARYYQNLTPALGSASNDQLVDYGTARLDVSWNLAVTMSGALTKPRFESVKFIEAVWGLGGLDLIREQGS
jgi:hypothetical protein